MQMDWEAQTLISTKPNLIEPYLGGTDRFVDLGVTNTMTGMTEQTGQQQGWMTIDGDSLMRERQTTNLNKHAHDLNDVDDGREHAVVNVKVG